MGIFDAVAKIGTTLDRATNVFQSSTTTVHELTHLQNPKRIKEPTDKVVTEKTDVEKTEKEMEKVAGTTSTEKSSTDSKTVPQAGPYTVEKKDSLWAILSRQGYSAQEIVGGKLQELAKLNHLADPNKLNAGDTIQLLDPKSEQEVKKPEKENESVKTDKPTLKKSTLKKGQKSKPTSKVKSEDQIFAEGKVRDWMAKNDSFKIARMGSRLPNPSDKGNVEVRVRTQTKYDGRDIRTRELTFRVSDGNVTKLTEKEIPYYKSQEKKPTDKTSDSAAAINRNHKAVWRWFANRRYDRKDISMRSCHTENGVTTFQMMVENRKDSRFGQLTTMKFEKGVCISNTGWRKLD